MGFTSKLDVRLLGWGASRNRTAGGAYIRNPVGLAQELGAKGLYREVLGIIFS